MDAPDAFVRAGDMGNGLRWMGRACGVTALLLVTGAADPMMTVHLGGHTYRLPRALDDGGSGHQEPGKREGMLLRADLPDITPHEMKEEYEGQSPFLGSMVEILAHALADRPGLESQATPEKARFYMRTTLHAIFNPGVEDMPELLLTYPDRAGDPFPTGPELRFVSFPKPWNPDYSRVFINGPPDDPVDLIECGGGECIHWFIWNGAQFQLTYGEHLVPDWASIHDSVAAVLDRSEIKE